MFVTQFSLWHSLFLLQGSGYWLGSHSANQNFFSELLSAASVSHHENFALFVIASSKTYSASDSIMSLALPIAICLLILFPCFVFQFSQLITISCRILANSFLEASDIISPLQSHKTTGVYASESQWSAIMGSYSGGARHQLW